MGAKSIVVIGKATPGHEVTFANPDNGTGTSADLRVPPDGVVEARVKLGPGKNSLTLIDYNYKGNPFGSRAVIVRRVSAGGDDPAPPSTPGEVGVARGRFLGKLQGKDQAQVRNLIGSPDHTQSVGGQEYWYYDYRDNQWQLVFAGGVVVEENKY